ncbi:NADH dehydrogenase [ubiquinone] 1 alpha subcomplex subunit 6-like [Convolutriloba macropyga]|uniref:NADH dehydrogenase [ubiquinone] 1 alpha subcomplex subunit 6-like n=1 Tax=Convolutriloba macropyga TaxID=536237 RepID=UPI003F522A63
MSFTKVVAANTKAFTKPLKPLFSANAQQARLRALRLYKLWYRECFDTIYRNELPFTTKELRKVLRAKFEEHSHVKDLRQIDALIFKGELELEESQKGWKQATHICKYLEMTKMQQPKSKDFLENFYSGKLN